MILLEFNNRIIFEIIRRAINNEKREVIDTTVADFDGVQFHIASSPDNKSIITVSLQWPAVKDCMQHGAKQMLEKIYGPMLQASAENGYDVTVQLDLDNLPQEKDRLPLKFSFLKRHVLAAPFQKVFGAIHQKKNPTGITRIAYRSEEAFFIKPENDRCIVVYCIRFTDVTDKVLSNVFLQEFADARRSMRGAPSLTYSHGEPPLELNGVPDVPQDDDVAFASFVLFEQHLDPKNVFKTINLIQSFRDYLHYHIKCSKAHMHTRMRERVANWMQVLNRARKDPFEKKEKKLASGKTFNRR